MSASIVALINAKGGSGATTIAIEVARAIRRGGKNVALVDGDLSGRRNVAVLLDAVRAFDSERATTAYSIIQHDGMTAVELTDSLDNSFMLHAEEVESVTEVLDGQNDVVLLDAPTPFSAALRPLIMRASRFVLIFEPNLLGSAAARSLIGDLAKVGVPMARICLVTNARAGRPEITSRELEKALGSTVIAEVPVRTDRNFGRALDVLAKRLAAITPEAPLESMRSAGAGTTSRAATLTPSNALGPMAQTMSANGQQAGRPRPVADESRDALKAEIHEQVTKRIDVVAASRAHTDNQKIAELRAQINDVTAQVLTECAERLSLEERAELQQEIIDELLGLGPIEDLMRDPAISEIMVNGPSMIYVERSGKLTLSDKRFSDERHLRTIIERIIAPLGRRIDESSPMVDARLPDGSRVNAIIEPLSLNGSTLTIRRFGTRRLTMDDLLRFGSVSPECVNLLKAMVESRLNIVVSGGTGSGKTTFLNILSGYIPHNERIVTIEDAAELSLNQEHVVRLESRPPNLEGRGTISIRDLVRNSLRMRPDRIVVGECRGGEALDMLQAMNTGHDGSLTTLHANTPRDAMSRLETMVLMAGFELPIRAIREQISGAVDVVVQIARLRDGSRRVTSIAEIVGMEGDIVTMQEIIKFAQRGIDKDGHVIGEFQYTGVQPHYMDRFEEAGIRFDVRELAKLEPVKVLW
jgi:pilus assembly protein CpaF